MIRLFGRALQVLGLVLVPVALAGNIAEAAGAPVSLDLKHMLIVAGIGVILFYIGHAIQGRSGTG